MAALALLGLGLTACGGGGTTPEDPEQLDPRVLYTFDSCEDMIQYAKDALAEHGDLYEDYGWGWSEGDVGVDNGGEPPQDGGEGTGGTGEGDTNGGSPDYSDTNVQEVGVDEPDLVKTDGRRILALAKGELHFVDPTGDAPALLGSLELGTNDGAQLFMVDDRALLIDTIYNYGGGYDDYGYEEPGLPQGPDVSQWFAPEEYFQITRLTEIDISDPAAMKVVANLYVGADYVSARNIDVTARVVLRSRPRGLEFKSAWDFIYEWMYGQGGDGEVGVDDGGEVPPEPVPDGGIDPEPAPDAAEGDVTPRAAQDQNPWDALWAAAVQAAKTHNDAVLDNSTPENWLPKYVYEDLSGGDAQITEGLLHDCDEVMHPGSYSGLGMLSVVTLDLASKLSIGHAIGLFSEGETVYSSRENLYVATHPWYGPANDGPGSVSYVHKFDLGDTSAAEYLASGEVPGYLLSQWAMSEHEGDLRVATTDWTGSEDESFVTVLGQEGDVLEQRGQVGGLGKGERIYAVRFIEDTGYVVTFRQIDPLYTIDLADPTQPTVAGELKIPGYSAYLHPVGEGLLLGVGREGNDDGQVFGTQLSLFDVSDIYNPVQLHTASVGGDGGASEVEWDHKAFLWWDPTDLVVLPVSWWSYDEMNGENYFQGAVGYRVDAGEGITELAQITHPQPMNEDPYYYYGTGLRRSLVIEDRLYTVSHHGIKASALADLSDIAFVGF